MATEKSDAKSAVPMATPATVAAAVPNGAGETGAAEGRKLLNDGTAQARLTMEKNMEQATKTAEGFFKAAEEAAEFGRGNLEAVAKATQTYMVGVQDLSRQYMLVAQGLTDHALEGAKALAGVKSLKEAAEVQSSFAKAALERAMAETAKLQEATFRLAEQSSAPITQRMTLAMEKMGRPVAA